MRRARSPMVRQRPLTFCSIALLLVVSVCSPHFSLAAQQHTSDKEASFQAAKQFIAAVSAPAPSIDLVALAPAPVDLAADVSEAPAPSGPELPGISFLGLPAVPLPYKDYSAEAPAETGAQAPSPEKATGQSTVKSFLESFVNEALPPIAKPFAGAAVSGAPLPSIGQVLATATQAIPAEAPAPAASLKVANPSGKSLVNVPFPNVQNVFSVLEKLGRRRLLADGAPALAPGPQPAGTFPALVNLEVDGNQANPSADSSFAESQWYKTEPQPGAGPQLQAQPQPFPQAQPDAQLQAQPQPQPQPMSQGQPQPLQNVELQTQETAIGGLPAAVAQAPVGAQPGMPQPGPLAPRAAPGMLGAPGLAPAPKAFGPIPSEVKVFAEKLANFLGAEARSQLPKRIEVNAGAGRRRLAQDGPEGAEPLPAMPLAAEAPMAAPGALPQPGPVFQALPEPVPLPPLPRPAPQLQAAVPDEASSMAPMAAPAGEGSAQLQARPDEGHHHHMSYMGTNNGRRLQQGPPGTVPEDIASAEPDAAMTPMAAPGALPQPELPQPNTVFQALPEPAPLPPLPRPAPQLQTMPAEAMAAMAPMSAMAGEAQPGAQYQARPAEGHHHHMSYIGTITRRHLLQGPPGTVPEGIEATQPDAAMTPMSAPGALPQPEMPQPGPVFQALPEPAPLPPLPRPAPQLQTMPAEAMAAMAPMSAMAGEAQPGAQYQARPAEGHHHHMSYIGTITRRHLLQGPPGTVPEGIEATQPDAAMTPMSAPGALPQPEMPQPGPVFQALPEPAPLPPLPRPAPQLQTMPAEAMAAMAPMSAMAGEAQPGAQYQARPAEGHHHHMSYIGTITRRHLLQGPSDGPPGTVPEDDVEIMDTQADAAYAPMSAMTGMPQPGPQFQALSQPGPLPVLPRPADAPEGAPAGEAQPGVSLQAKASKKATAKAEAANANPKGENHVNPPAKVATASTATSAAAVTDIKTTAGRKLQAAAPAPAPEQGPAARRDMPPLPPVMPGMSAGAQPPQPGQGAPQVPGVGVFEANDPNASEAPALQVPKEYETGLINAFKQAIPQYLSNALSMSGK